MTNQITNYEVFDLRSRKTATEPAPMQTVPVYDFKDGKLTTEYRPMPGAPKQHGLKGQPKSEQTRERMRNSALEREPMSEATRAKIRATHQSKRIQQEQLIARLTEIERQLSLLTAHLIKPACD